jgi:hypothetical protein
MVFVVDFSLVVTVLMIGSLGSTTFYSEISRMQNCEHGTSCMAL